MSSQKKDVEFFRQYFHEKCAGCGATDYNGEKTYVVGSLHGAEFTAWLCTACNERLQNQSATCLSIGSVAVQKLEEVQGSPVVVLHQTRSYLADRCGSMQIVLSSAAPSNPQAWLQEFQHVNDLRVLAEQYLEAFLAVKGKTP